MPVDPRDLALQSFNQVASSRFEIYLGKVGSVRYESSLGLESWHHVG